MARRNTAGLFSRGVRSDWSNQIGKLAALA